RIDQLEIKDGNRLGVGRTAYDGKRSAPEYDDQISRRIIPAFSRNACPIGLLYLLIPGPRRLGQVGAIIGAVLWWSYAYDGYDYPYSASAKSPNRGPNLWAYLKQFAPDGAKK